MRLMIKVRNEEMNIGRYEALAQCGRYQIRLETNDVAVLDHVSKVLKNQLEGSGRHYRIEYRCESEALTFIRWLLS